MRNESFLQAYDSIKPDPAAREEMLARILASREAEVPSRPKGQILFRRVLPAACAAAVLVGVFFTLPHSQTSQPPATAFHQVAPGADSPNGIRKTMNCNGLRYTFLDNGAAYDLTADDLSAPLGTLEYDIQQDPEHYSGADLAASFAVGGTVYQMAAYDPAFRLAVEWNGQYYIAECVDTLNGQDLELSTYFETADFADTVELVQICDHAGQNVLRTISGDKIQALFSLLVQAAPAELTNEQYQAIAHAQSSGASYQLLFQLKDGTAYHLYVIPTLSFVSAGDNRYLLPDASAQDLNTMFSDLQQSPLPMG